jgi:hypothetical protein
MAIIASAMKNCCAGGLKNQHSVSQFAPNGIYCGEMISSTSALLLIIVLHGVVSVR